MSTSYSLADSLPRDAGGAKFAGWVNVATSQLDFCLPAGIGSKTVGSKIVGELVTTQYAGTTCVLSGSTNLITTSSGILYRFIAAGCGVVAGAQMAVLNGIAGAATSIAHVVFSGANETIPIDFGPGACFGALRYELRGSVGTGYATAVFKQYGQL